MLLTLLMCLSAHAQATAETAAKPLYMRLHEDVPTNGQVSRSLDRLRQQVGQVNNVVVPQAQNAGAGNGVVGSAAGAATSSAPPARVPAADAGVPAQDQAALQNQVTQQLQQALTQPGAQGGAVDLNRQLTPEEEAAAKKLQEQTVKMQKALEGLEKSQ